MNRISKISPEACATRASADTLGATGATQDQREEDLFERQTDCQIRNTVRESYGKAVQAIAKGAGSQCCGAKSSVLKGVDPITRDLYSSAQASEVPSDALLASFGCGNPTALAPIEAGDVVLDLGSGGGIDVLLSAKRVGPQGKAYGLDMTTEMLELARRNQAAANATNVEFLQGTIEAIPLPDASVDVIISNCVINLSADKDQALREAFRVLRPGGRFAVSDIVLTRDLPVATRESIELWAGCIAGALPDGAYTHKLITAGFADVTIEPTRVYSSDDAQEIIRETDSSDDDARRHLQAIDGAIMSAFIRARKPYAYSIA